MIQGGESFRLIVRRGPQPNQIYELTKELVTIGRDITNDIVINDPEVSRHHLRLARGAGGFTLEDLGSTNGTFVNGQRLTGARPLRNGELIGLGETVTLSYEALAAPAANTLASSPAESEAPRYSPPPGVQPTMPPQPSPYAPPQPQRPLGAEGGQPGYVPFTPGQPAPGQPMPGQPPQIRYTAPPEPRLTPEGQPIYPGLAGAQPQNPPYAGFPGTAQPAAPPGFGSDYDPYAAREQQPRSTARYILLGCGGLAVFCCCATGLGVLVIDQLCLWENIPILYDVLRAFGVVATC